MVSALVRMACGAMALFTLRYLLLFLLFIIWYNKYFMTTGKVLEVPFTHFFINNTDGEDEIFLESLVVKDPIRY